MSVDDVIQTPPAQRIKMAQAARLAGIALQSLLRKVRQRKLAVVKAGRGWETTAAAVHAMLAAETEAALGKIGRKPAAPPTPAARSRSHRRAMAALAEAGLIGK